MSCTDCKALSKYSVDITVADDSENLIYRVDAVCESAGKKERVVPLEGESLDKVVNIMFPEHVAGMFFFSFLFNNEGLVQVLEILESP